MLFTKKWKTKFKKLSYLFGKQTEHNVLVGECLEHLENRIKELERRSRDNENVIEHLIELTKPLDKRTYKDENQTELKLRS